MKIFYTRNVVLSVLITQLVVGFSPPVLAAESDETPQDQIAQEIEEFSSELNLSRGQTDPAHVRDPFYVTNQFHRVFRPTAAPDGRSLDVVVKEIRLDGVDPNNESPAVLDPSRELRFDYDAETKEFSILRVVFDKTLNRERITDAHVFKNIEVTSNAVADSNLIQFASTLGIHAILWSYALDNLFSAPLFAPVVVGLPSGQKITHLESLSRASQPEPYEVQMGDGGSADRHEELDLGATIQNMVAGKEEKVRFTRHEILTNLRISMRAFLPFLEVANPDLEHSGEIRDMLNEELVDKNAFDAEQMSVLDEPPADPEQDVVMRAIRAFGQTTRYEKFAGLLERKKNKAGVKGSDDLQNLIDSPRDTFSSDPSSTSQWSTDYNTIQQGRKIYADVGLKKSWREILIESFKHKNELSWKSAAKHEALLQQSLFYRWQTKFVKLATKINMQRVTAAISVVALGYVAGHFIFPAQVKWAIAGMLHVIDWSTRAPLLGAVTKPVVDSFNYMKDGWNLARLAIGLGIIMALNPLSYMAAGSFAKAAGRDWDSKTAFFNYGIRFYAKGTYPIQKLLLWDRIGLGHVYDWFDAGLNPLEHREAFKTDGAAEMLKQTVETEATRKTRALLIAAAIVSAASNKTNTPVDIGSLLIAGQGKKIETYVDLAQDPVENSKWTDVTLQAYHALAQMGDEGVGTIDESTIGQYVGVYGKLLKDFQYRMQNADKMGVRLRASIRELSLKCKRMMSHQILPYLLFGVQGYKVYKKYRNAEVDPLTSRIADKHYTLDYEASAVYYAAVAPDAFAQIATLGKGGFRILGDQTGQVFIYGVQGAIDPLSAAESDALKNPAPPITNGKFSDRRSRPQTFGEAAAAIAGASLDPNTKSYFDNHATYMTNLLSGFQTRGSADYITRMFGMTMTRGAFALGPMLLLSAKTLAFTAVFLLAKISFDYSSAVGFGIGYAAVWPYIQLMFRFMENGAEKNKARVELADHFINTGLQFKDDKMMTSGISIMQELYREDGRKLPSRYDMAPAEFSRELAQEFHSYTMREIPVPTRSNPLMTFILNVGVGSAISTILFNPLSMRVYDPAVGALGLLGHTLLMFGLTYVGLKTLAPITRQGAKLVRKALEPHATTASSTRCGDAMDTVIE